VTLKVLHVIPTLDPKLGGPCSAVIGMSKHLVERDVAPVIVATTTGPQWQSDGVPTTQTPVENFRVFPASFYCSPELARWLEKRVRDFDILHVHTIFNFPSALACRVARHHGIPYIVRPCGMLDPWSLAQGRLKKSIWLRLIERANLSGACAVHFTSDEERLAALNFTGNAPCVVIPLGIDIPIQQPAGPIAAKKRILFLSRLHPKKGVEHLVEALSELRLRDDFIFVIAGSGEAAYERHLRRLVFEAGLDTMTEWCGFVTGDKKETLFRGADIFVLPSYQENFGIAVAEAMAYGKAVVISDQVNIHSIVSNNNAGIVIRPNGESLASAIRRLLDDESLRKLCGANAVSAAFRYFSWDTITQELIDLYIRCRKKQPLVPE
jgi:glycosyltransferase involved in cell wall biosynthesis